MGRACGDMTQSSHCHNVRFGKDLAKMEKTDFPRRDSNAHPVQRSEHLRSGIGLMPDGYLSDFFDLPAWSDRPRFAT